MLRNIVSILFALGMLLSSASAWAALINLNAANAEEIAEAMNGVGSVRAAAIVEERKRNGKFKSLGEVPERVNGVGDATIEKNKDKVTVK
ncbi:MAG: ComEA family DNA-binding protein [Methylohalobius sp. ZOD2]|nr:helix-hairpin-helix domain-containing protein [Methylothermaceae bacterium]